MQGGQNMRTGEMGRSDRGFEIHDAAGFERSPLVPAEASLRHSLEIAADFEAALGHREDSSGMQVERGGLEASEAAVEVPLLDSKGEVRHLVSRAEAAIYEDAGLRPEEVAGRECLVRDDIDWEQTDSSGRTNAERARQGLAPLAPNGRPYELHHVGQESDGMLAELTVEEHRGAGNDGILHDPERRSEIDRDEFASQRAEHWKARAPEGGSA